jgi:glycosyltransferase involved in cell wall biosynthesis
MIGRRPGYVVTQGLVLHDHFARAGYETMATSSALGRLVRLADTVLTLVRARRKIDILVLDIYGGRSFVIEDVVTWLGRRFGLRLVLLLHGGALPGFMRSFPRWSRRVLRRGDAIVAPSDYLSRAARAQGFGCRIIPNLVDVSRYPYRHRPVLNPRLFWMRTFHPIYNPALAVRVLAALRAEFPGATLVMAGQDKGMEAEIRRLARTLGVDGAVRFPGFLDMAGKVREGSAADIFVNTSRVDNMPVAILEAGAMGLPIVSTTVGGIADLLRDGESGLLVPDDDADRMVAAIRGLLADPSLAARLSANGRALAECSGWERVRPQWESLFLSLGLPTDGRQAEAV